MHSPSLVSADVGGHIAASAFVGRIALGWQWVIGTSWFVEARGLGVAVPFGTQREADLGADVNLAGSGPVARSIESYLQQLADKEAEALEDATLEEMARYDTLPLPIISVAIGWWLK